MSLAALTAAAGADRLFVSGLVPVTQADGLPEGFATLALLSPDEPGFWAHVQASPEFADGAPDPLDRWSARVIGALAKELDGLALFPFDGPPWRPFHDWALRSGRAWTSPVRLLVHERMGLWASFRGAIALREVIREPARPAPCATCNAPCLHTCPVGAMGGTGYDVAACHSHLDETAGKNCLAGGCLVRRACPQSETYGRLPEQSAWHMRQFHK